jgi:energy-coupling factor transport system substrate-specific component
MYDNPWFILYVLTVPMFMVGWVTWLLVKRREDRMQRELAAANRMVEMGKQTVVAIARAVDAKDPRTGGHSRRVALYSKQMAKEFGLSDKDCQDIEWAANLHDIGKIAIPDAILNKDSRLTDEEYAIMKSHTIQGAKILSDFTLLDHVIEGAEFHHERYDGRGYPKGLQGEEIPLYARIIGVADAFDAMTANRVYRKQMDFGYVLGELEKGRGTQFASEFVDILMNLIKTNVIDLNELYGIKPEDSQQAIEAAKPAESGTEKAADGSGTTADASASGEGGKS